MHVAEAIAASTAIAALALPCLAIALGAARRLAAVRPRVPSSRFGGMVILCAALGGLGRAASGIAAVAPVITRTVPAAAPTSPPLQNTGSYIVNPGDSLWAIASRHLEAGGASPTDVSVDRMWRSIYAANRQVIGDDPDLIYPGTRLTIPGERA